MQIIHVNLTQESPKLIDAGKALDMTYSVKWEPTNVTFAHRFDVYLDYPFFEHQVITSFDTAIKGNFGSYEFWLSNFSIVSFAFNYVVYILPKDMLCALQSSDHFL
jgi:hypothetical protein